MSILYNLEFTVALLSAFLHYKTAITKSHFRGNFCCPFYEVVKFFCMNACIWHKSSTDKRVTTIYSVICLIYCLIFMLIYFFSDTIVMYRGWWASLYIWKFCQPTRLMVSIYFQIRHLKKGEHQQLAKQLLICLGRLVLGQCYLVFFVYDTDFANISFSFVESGDSLKVDVYMWTMCEYIVGIYYMFQHTISDTNNNTL